MKLIPYRVFVTSQLSDPSVGPTSMRFPFSLDITRTSPVWGCASLQPRFHSQGFYPLSGFLAGPSFATVFHATTVRESSSFRAFPSQEIAYPSRGSLAPLRLSTSVLEPFHPDLIVASFADSHAFAQLPGSPADYRFPFSAYALPGPPESRL
jgi:hypothetical protein